ncbi:MAG: hypothetical protein J6Y16_02805 [Treponema sp.]|nr:hypothetical protein [Treponema sp.]MBP5451146.1 hypothetical protein [Treponema sp.]
MISIPAYFDGNTVRLIGDYTFEKNQKLMITVVEDIKENKSAGIKSLRGCLSKYANPDLVPKEKEAWATAMEEKHGLR